MKIAFLTPTLGIGGGYHVILQYARHARTLGHEVCLVLLAPPTPHARRWAATFGDTPLLPLHKAQSVLFDVGIATAWGTVYSLPRLVARQYAYFVQGIESWFFPDADIRQRRLADATYRCPIPMLAVSRGITEYLEKTFNATVFHTPNGVRKETFSANGPTAAPPCSAGLRVLVEGPLTVGIKNVPRTLEIVRTANAGETWLITSSDVSWYPGVSKIFRNLSPEEMAVVYRSCDVLIKLSTVEGFGLPPLEMFHCGGTSVANRAMGRKDFMHDGKNALLVDIGDDEGAAAALERLASDASLLARLKNGARATAAEWPSEQEAADHFVSILEKIRQLPRVEATCISASLDGYMEDFFSSPASSSLFTSFTASLKKFRQHFPRLKRLTLPLYSRYILAKDNTFAKRSYTCSLFGQKTAGNKGEL